jgi:hypothetical protein
MHSSANGKTRAAGSWLRAWYSKAHPQPTQRSRGNPSVGCTSTAPRPRLEKITVATRRPVDLAKELERDDALGDLLRLIQELETSPLPLEDLTAEFAELKTKLPVEIVSGDDALDPTDPQFLRAALPDVKELLLSRLLDRSAET